MKKFLLALLAAMGATASLVPAAYAQQTVTSNFSVTVTLNGRCKATTGNNSASTTLGFGTYTAFQAGTSTGSVDLYFDCTRGLAPTSFSFDTTNTDALTIGAGNYGVIAGLNYSLATSASTTAGTAATAANGGVGTADLFKVNVAGTMAAGQAGACASAAATAANCNASASSQTRTLTVTY